MTEGERGQIVGIIFNDPTKVYMVDGDIKHRERREKVAEEDLLMLLVHTFATLRQRYT
jgi:hypothetical protein